MIGKVISSVPLPTAAKRAAAEGARRRLELRRAAAAGRCLAPGGGEDRRPITEQILDAQPCVSDAGRRGRPVRLVPAPDEVTLPEGAVLGARRRATPTERSVPGWKETP